MNIQKWSRKHNRNNRNPFVTWTSNGLYISAGLRDWIEPYHYLAIAIDENDNIVLTPTNNTNQYTVVKGAKGQTQVSCYGLLHYFSSRCGKRMPCERLDNGAILCRTGQ